MERQLATRNYLRVRGEYIHRHGTPTRHPELPPRARRIQSPPPTAQPTPGTTSACAENTCGFHRHSRIQWNYLRVRGEYSPHRTANLGDTELPPRARRIREHAATGKRHMGTTSACAENTATRTTPSTPGWNYLRVRGEYTPTNPGAGKPLELPPRARRIRPACGYRYRPGGTTSACAENTTAWVF